VTLAIEFSAWRDVRIDHHELRLGWITLWWASGSASNQFARYRTALGRAADTLRKDVS
jgi:hypothetical protein